MWELYSKEAECQRIDAFELWCWRRLVRIPRTARRSNQSILKVISPGCSLEGLMVKLKLQYFGHLMRRPDSLEKTVMLGKIEGGRRRGQQRMRWLDGITDSKSASLTFMAAVPCSVQKKKKSYSVKSELTFLKQRPSLSFISTSFLFVRKVIDFLEEPWLEH